MGPITINGTHLARPVRARHLRAAAVALVMLGGLLGAAGREALEQALPPRPTGFPVATFFINLAGAFALGALVEGLVRAGDDTGWRRTARLAAGPGFCGAFTTYSTLAVESVQLSRHGAWSTAVLYLAVSVVGGLVAAGLGIAVAAGRARWAESRLPVDPDLERLGDRR